MKKNHNIERYSGHENLLAMNFAVNYNAFIAKQLKKFVKNQNQKILDFGAGVGVFSRVFRDIGILPICVELDSEQSELLKSEGYTVYADLTNVANQSIEYVYSVNVMEHIENDIDVMRNIHQKLILGGIFLVYVPAVPWIYSAMDCLVGHFRRYTKSELEKKLEIAGFSVVQSEYVDFLGVWASFIFKYMDRSGGKITPNSVKLYDRFLFPISRVFDLFFSKLIGKNLLVIARKV